MIFDGVRLDEDEKFEIEVEFGASGKDFDELTNENKPLKIIRTVARATEIVIDKYEEEIFKILFYGVKKPGERAKVTQRAKIYKRFLKLLFRRKNRKKSE